MSSLQPESVAIHRLRIRGVGDSGAAGLERVGGQLRRKLDFARWPEAPGQSWVFIRQVQARGPGYRLAEQLVEATRTQLERGDADNVVRFASLADLLAALLTDLIRGQAADRWYWRRWSHLFRLPVAAAIRQLLTEHLSRLPSVCARLAQQQALTEVWLTLDEAGAGQLLQELAWHSGFELPETRQLERERLKAGLEPPMPALLPGNRLWLHWAPVLHALPVTDLRFRLALCLIAQQLAPLQLIQAPAALLARLTEMVEAQLSTAARSRPLPSAAVQERALHAAGPARVSSPAVFSDSRSSDGVPAESQVTSDTGSPGDPLRPEQQAPAVPLIASASSQPAPAESAAHPSFRDVQSDDETSPLPGRNGGIPDTGSNSGSQRPPPPRQALRFAAPDPDFTQFATAQGGLLYLLNFLNRPQAQTLLEDNWEDLASGWGWLYRLGQTLQLDESDPIVAFIATQLGLERAQELDQIPPLPAREALLDLAHRWYGGANLWQPELLRLNARIQPSPSHLDLYAPLTAVRLPVRLAGLDIDPGWLPWLGRVVSFHYD